MAALALAGGDCRTTLLSTVSNALLPFFTAAEACELRLVNKEFAQTVSAFPFEDRATAVPLAALLGWRACLPRARCLRLAPFHPDMPCAWGPEHAAALASLRELDLSHPSGAAPPAALLPGLLSSLPATLASLCLKGAPTGSLQPSALSRFPKLRSLDASHTALRLSTPALLAPLAGLRHLRLAGCKAAFEADALAPLTQLLTLDVSHTGITDCALARGLPALRTLLMHGCSRLTGKALAACPALEELGMADCREAAATFTPATLAALPRLRVLRMACTSLPQPSLLAPLAGTLQELDCSGCAPAMVAALGELFAGGPLRALNVSLPRGMAPYSPPSAIRALEDALPALLPLLAQLHTLNASYLLLTPGALAALAAASPRLRSLHLDCTQQQAPYYRDAQRKDAQPWACAQGLAALLAFPRLRALQSNAGRLAGAVGALLPQAGQARAALQLLAQGERQRVEALAPTAGSGRGPCAPHHWHPMLYEQHDALQALCKQVRLEALVQAGFPLPLLLLPAQQEWSALPMLGPAAARQEAAGREAALQRVYAALCAARPSTPRAQHLRSLGAVGAPLAPPAALLALARAQRFPLPELLAAALPLRLLLASGLAPLPELLAGGHFTLSHLLHSGASARSLVGCGVALPALLAAGAQPRALYSPGFSSLFTLQEMLGQGVGVQALAAAGASCRALRIAGVGREALLGAGFAEGEVGRGGGGGRGAGGGGRGGGGRGGSGSGSSGRG